jgi:predicted porin
MNKKALAVAIAGALAVPTAAQAVDVKLSGQLNRAIMLADDGVDSDAFHVDNANSNSRFRFTGSEKMANGMTVGINWEMQYISNASSGVVVNPKMTTDAAGPTFGERIQEIYFGGKWGKLTMGQGNGAANGTLERDLSGTTVAALASRQTVGGAISYRLSAAGNANSGTTVGAAFNHFDGRSRYDMVRYDSPTLGPGIVLSASHGLNDVYEFAGSIRTSFAGGKLDAAVNYSEGSARFGNDQVGGSASFLFSQGTSISVHYGQRDFDAAGRGNADTYGIKLGHKWGNHAVSIDYADSSDTAAAGVDSDTIGVAWVYTIPKPKVELYALYRNWDLDGGTVVGATEDVDIFMVGSRVKF